MIACTERWVEFEDGEIENDSQIRVLAQLLHQLRVDLVPQLDMGDSDAQHPPHLTQHHLPIRQHRRRAVLGSSETVTSIRRGRGGRSGEGWDVDDSISFAHGSLDDLEASDGGGFER